MSAAPQLSFLPRAENAVSLPPMREWQARTVVAIREAIRQGHRRIVVQSPTGAGKTLLAAHLFAGSIAKGRRPLFTVPDISLVNQTLRSFERVGILDVGVIQARHERTDFDAQVQIASVASLLRRTLPEVDLIVVDEAHVQHVGFIDLMSGPAWKDKVIIGLSATPWARGMGLHWTKLIIGATIGELIGNGVLCGFQGYGPAVDADLSKVHTVAGEYNERESAAVMSDKRIVGDVVEHWIKYGRQDRTFMFCVNRAHAREQQSKFAEAGIPFGYIDGAMDADEREVVFEQFRAGSVAGIASVGCLSRGVDEDVRCVIDAAPTKSEMLYVQRIGRGLRSASGKERLLILDPAGNALRLGTVTDIHHDTLDSRVPGSKEEAFAKDGKAKPAHKCPRCNSIVAFHLSKCDLCGYVLKTTSSVPHTPGQLAEYGAKPAKPAKVTLPKAERQTFYGGLLTLALERKKAEGWAAHRYREKFHDWPSDLAKVPGKVTLQVASFDKYQRIRYAKAMAKGGKGGK